MHPVSRLFLAIGLALLAVRGLHAQSSEDPAVAQEHFALAVATAHARSSLFVVGSKPFAISATVTSSLALHGTGKGTYENRWVDAQHWQREIRFPDFEQSEMRNDSGHSWVDQSSGDVPLRIAELLRVVVIHVPGSNTASRVPMEETSATGAQGEPLTCYAGAPPTPPDGFLRRFRYCFDQATGLLVSQDMPLHTHIDYTNYIAFQGKHEFTHVRVTSGNLTVLDLDIRYSALDAHALDRATPGASMHRSESAGSTPNPEELSKGTVEYRVNPVVPPGTPDADKDRSVEVQFHVSAADTVLDACVEDAPTEAMAEAALEAARQFRFTPLTVDGKPVGNRFYYSVWFRSSGNDASSGSDTAKTQPGGSETARSAAGFEPKTYGMYRSKEPLFAFRYPGDFDEIPRGELEHDRRSGGGPHEGGSKPGDGCNTLLFKAQRLRPDDRTLEVMSLYDLSPDCIFGPLDKEALGSMTVNAARSVVAQWIEGRVSKPKWFVVNGRRTFAVVSVSGQAKGSGQMQALLVTTAIQGHVVGWLLVGSDDKLAETLAGCMLQIGEQKESPLLSPPVTP